MTENEEKQVVFDPENDTEGYWHELTDRIHCISFQYESLIQSHPVALHPDVREQIHVVGGMLFNLYQQVANQFFDKFNSEQK